MKNALKILLIIFLVLGSVGILFVGQGYKMYKNALNEVSLSDKVEQIRNSEDYIKI